MANLAYSFKISAGTEYLSILKKMSKENELIFYFGEESFMVSNNKMTVNYHIDYSDMVGGGQIKDTIDIQGKCVVVESINFHELIETLGKGTGSIIIYSEVECWKSSIFIKRLSEPISFVEFQCVIKSEHAEDFTLFEQKTDINLIATFKRSSIIKTVFSKQCWKGILAPNGLKLIREDSAQVNITLPNCFKMITPVSTAFDVREEAIIGWSSTMTNNAGHKSGVGHILCIQNKDFPDRKTVIVAVTMYGHVRFQCILSSEIKYDLITDE